MLCLQDTEKFIQLILTKSKEVDPFSGNWQKKDGVVGMRAQIKDLIVDLHTKYEAQLPMEPARQRKTENGESSSAASADESSPTELDPQLEAKKNGKPPSATEAEKSPSEDQNLELKAKETSQSTSATGAKESPQGEPAPRPEAKKPQPRELSFDIGVRESPPGEPQIEAEKNDVPSSPTNANKSSQKFLAAHSEPNKMSVDDETQTDSKFSGVRKYAQEVLNKSCEYLAGRNASDDDDDEEMHDTVRVRMPGEIADSSEVLVSDSQTASPDIPNDATLNDVDKPGLADVWEMSDVS